MHPVWTNLDFMVHILPTIHDNVHCLTLQNFLILKVTASDLQYQVSVVLLSNLENLGETN